MHTPQFLLNLDHLNLQQHRLVEAAPELALALVRSGGGDAKGVKAAFCLCHAAAGESDGSADVDSTRTRVVSKPPPPLRPHRNPALPPLLHPNDGLLESWHEVCFPDHDRLDVRLLVVILAVPVAEDERRLATESVA
eukprot:CAMPEP_0206251186 /NCGR_PEP_ID=MMETSP0047_2-20121206/21887_1 /ASSEMBLY_ACC=CAM_ASM_000192 /TAXON_ID=195065 /ORGANISM="Chroomonas mesostigmatica_cf, Strain CCMP1168" /LENGTH=136 /DNA_ID=CAMNT_0053677117 /DNA_START=249 /DNA_END=659 /DNA_ORIENTATION=-